MRGMLRRGLARRSPGLDESGPNVSDLRSAALSHEQSGGVHEAIAAWTGVNHLQPDAIVEAHLVDLRCDPRIHQPAGPGIQPWPRDLADPFPGLTGRPPEIAADELSMGVLGGAILHHGCVIVRGLLAPDRIPTLRSTIDRAIAGRRESVGGKPTGDTTPWYQPCARWDALTPDKARKARRYTDRGGSAVHLCDSPRGVFQVIDALRSTNVLRVISDYLGEEAVISANKSMLRRVPPDAAPSWHQDGSFMGTHTRAVNTWVSLSDCGEGRPAPGLAFLPHRLDASVRGEVADGNIVFTADELEAASRGRSAVRPVFAPGDALLFDELLAHANGGGEPGFTLARYALEAWMFAPSHMPAGYVPIATV